MIAQSRNRASVSQMGTFRKGTSGAAIEASPARKSPLPRRLMALPGRHSNCRGQAAQRLLPPPGRAPATPPDSHPGTPDDARAPETTTERREARPAMNTTLCTVGPEPGRTSVRVKPGGMATSPPARRTSRHAT